VVPEVRRVRSLDRLPEGVVRERTPEVPQGRHEERRILALEVPAHRRDDARRRVRDDDVRDVTDLGEDEARHAVLLALGIARTSRSLVPPGSARSLQSISPSTGTVQPWDLRRLPLAATA
jgi:hypothetical protein